MPPDETRLAWHSVRAYITAETDLYREQKAMWMNSHLTHVRTTSGSPKVPPAKGSTAGKAKVCRQRQEHSDKGLPPPLLDNKVIRISSRKSRNMSLHNSRSWLSVYKDRSQALALLPYTSVARRKKEFSNANSSSIERIAILYISAKSLSCHPPRPPSSTLLVDLAVLTVCRILCAHILREHSS